MSPSWLGFTVTHLWKHDLYPLCFSLSRSWSSVASTGRWIKLQVKRSLFSSSSNVSGPFAHGPALSPLSLSPCLLLLWCCSLHSSTLSVHLHVTMYQQERFPSDPARAKTALARAQWQTDDGARGGGWGGHEPKTAHCILTEWGIKSSLSFSISSAEMQSLDSSVTALQGFENIARA